MTYAEKRLAFFPLDQNMTTQEQVVATQAQSMEAPTIRKVVPRVQQNASTTTSHLRYFTRINHSMFLGQNLMKIPKNSLMRSIRVSNLWG